MAELQNNLERNQVYLPRQDYPRDHIVLAMNLQQVRELMHNFNQLNNNNNNQRFPGNNLPNGIVQIQQLDPEDGVNNLERNQVYLPIRFSMAELQNYPRDHIVLAMNPQQVRELIASVRGRPQLDPEDGINNLLPLYVGAQGFIFNSAFFVEGRTGCEILWTPFILSGLVSLATIAAVLNVFFHQFRQLREENYWSWVAEKVAIIMMLIVFSVCLLLCCTSVLCISGR